MRTIDEFKAFILRGNVLDLAIGVVIGVAFNAVVNSFVKDIIMGLIANIFAQPDLSYLAWGSVKWGSFLDTVINLLIVGVSVFVAVKVANRFVGTKINLNEEAKK